MSVTPTSIRQRVAAQIAAVLGIVDTPWRESRMAFDAFPELDTRQIQHQAYAVGLGSTVPLPLDRQKRAVGARSVTGVSVKFAYRIRGDAAVADYDAAVTSETLLMQTVLAMTEDPQLSLRWLTTLDRLVVDEGTLYIGQINFAASHTMALS